MTSRCGHDDLRVRNYGDDYRWLLRCGVCGQEERRSQREWGGSLRTTRAAKSLISVTREPAESARLA